MATEPSVSVILPILDEVDLIDDVIGDIMAQDYPGPLELIVADGRSTDGTKAKLDNWVNRESRVKVIDNPDRRQAFGLNLAAAASSGSILVRADGHTRYAPDYVSKSIKAIEELNGAVGGRMRPSGESDFGRAVTAAMASPLTMGPGRFHHAITREQVDTVYLGAFEKSGFEELGGFRPFPSGTSEDADFYYRWRVSGRTVFVDPAIESTYRPRDTAGALWRQYLRYGQGKAEMLWLNGELPSVRPLAPLLLVLGLLSGLIVGVGNGVWWPIVVISGAWGLLLIWVATRSQTSPALVLIAAGIMHLAYGIGMVWGLIRGPGPIRSLRS